MQFYLKHTSKLQVYGLQFRSEIEEGATRFALGYVGLAVGASLTYFTAVRLVKKKLNLS